MSKKEISWIVKQLNYLNPDITFTQAKIGKQDTIILIASRGKHAVYAPVGYSFGKDGVTRTDRANGYDEHYPVLVVDRSHYI